MHVAPYDLIGRGYRAARRADPRIAVVLRSALAGCESVVSVGGGTGSYEPNDCRVIAVEPSVEMIRQRPPGAAPAIQGIAEALPFEDDAFDAAMAILTLHHWNDTRAGVQEMVRVAARVVILTWDPAGVDRFWLTNDYFPEFIEEDLKRFTPIADLALWLGGRTEVSVVPVPHDCTDGFLGAYWRRPDAYLDPKVRRGISSFCGAERRVVERGLAKLSEDVADGTWMKRHGHLMAKQQLDLGYRLLVCRAREE